VTVPEVAGIAGLGAFHGLNPAMGWLFAVALGLQEQSRRAVYRALGPIATGHALSIALAIVAFEGLRSVVSTEALRISGAVALAAFACWKLISQRHLRWVGFRLGPRDLVLWSFLMASAHGAGLMLLPLVVGMQLDPAQGAVTAAGSGALAVLIHTAAMLLVAGSIAVIVYEVVGVGILRSSWVNVDRLWAGALLVGAMATLLG
jgi:hypothetical protein